MPVNLSQPNDSQPHLKTKLKWAFALLALIVIVIGSFTFSTASTGSSPSMANPNDQAQVTRGKVVYDRFCSLCHGKDLQGEPNWRRRKANGRLPAPPHDESGHTWHHSDELLFGMTKYGLVPPYGPENYESDMPPWKDTLSDEDIWATLAYIKSRWPKELQQAQERQNQASQP